MNVLCTVILVSLTIADGFRILGVFPFHGKSHWAMYGPIMKELARKGHEVDVISPFPLQQPMKNYKDITVNINSSFNFDNDVTIDYVNNITISFEMIEIMEKTVSEHCLVLKDHKLQHLIQNTPRDAYDLVITEIFLTSCFLAFGHQFDAPIVGVTSSVMLPWGNDALGNVDNPSYIPNYMLPFTERMAFWQRLVSTVFNHCSKIFFGFFARMQEEIMKDVFGPDVPSVRELERRIDLLLVNSHFSLNGVRPFTPGVVEVGGLHLRDDKGPLSTELSKWLNESSSGVVYFSLGSMVRSETFPPEVLASFYASFAKLAPIRVLWVAKKPELLKGLPENVMAMPWVPQSLVIKHRNVKAFITHGGLMGTQEAVAAGVPMVGIPMFADQHLNVQTCVNKKITVLIDKNEINEDTLDKALNAILYDPTYQENARRLSNLFNDRPRSALDTAVWWIEYIGRNGKGALRSPSLDLTWWQVALLDVYGFLILSAILTFYSFRLILKKLLSIFMTYWHLKSKKIQ